MNRIFCLLTIFCILGCEKLPAQWVQTNGPYGGNVSSLAVIGPNLFVGISGRIFRSIDNGTSWTEVGTGLPRGTIKLVVSSTVLYAGIYDGGVFRSADNGANWRAVNNGLTSKAIHFLGVVGTNVFAGTSHGKFF